MPTRDELANALRKADAAGAVDDARQLAAAIRSLDAQPAVPQQSAGVPSSPQPSAAPLAPAVGSQPARSKALPPYIDPLAPKDPAEKYRQLQQSGMMQLATDDGVEWVPDIGTQIRGESERRHEIVRNQAAKAADAQWRYDNPGLAIRKNISDAILGEAAQWERGFGETVNRGLDLVDKDRNAAKFFSDTFTPIAQKLGPAQADGSGLLAPITGGLTEFGATALRDPGDAARQANQALNPIVPLSEGYSQLVDAGGDAIEGRYGTAGQKALQGGVNVATGVLGMVPGGSFTVDAMRAPAKAFQAERAAQIARIIEGDTGRAAAPRIAGPAQAGGGPPLPPPAAPTAPAASRLPRPQARAADIFIKKLQADGLTLEDIGKIQRSLAARGDSGVYETSGELASLSGKSSGANLRGLQMAAGAAPGPAQEALVARVNENATKMPARVSRAATRATGQKAEDAVSTLQELDQRLKTESGPLYEAFHSSPVDPNTFQREVLPILNTEAGQVAAKQALGAVQQKEARLRARVAGGKASDATKRELEHATEAVRSLQGYLADPVTGTAIPSPYALDRIKRAFDNQVEAAGQGSEIARDIRGTKSDFAEAVSNATGTTYGQALGFYEGNKRLRDAFEFGTQALNKKTWQLEEKMASGLKGRAWSAGEGEAVAMGVARHIEDLLEAGDNAAVTKLMKGKALANIATALGSEKAAKQFEQSIKRIGANREWGRRVAGGSDTAMRQAAIKDASAEGEDVITRALDRVEGSGNAFSIPGLVNDVAIKPIARVAKDAYQHLRYPGVYNEEVNAALAPMLANAMTKGNFEELVKTIEARMAEKGTLPQTTGAATPRRTPPGTTSSSPGAVGGATVGGAAGYFAPADSEDDRMRNAALGILGGGAGGYALERMLGNGGKAIPRDTPPPPPSRSIPPSGGRAVSNAEKALSDHRVASQLSPEQFKPLADDIIGQMDKLNKRTVTLSTSGEKVPYTNTREGYAETKRLNDLLVNHFKREDGSVDIEKAMRWAEKNDPDRVMRVEAGRAVQDLEDGIPPSASVTPLPPKPPVKNGLGSLPMDEGARMARAREQGFDVDTPLYHGTNRNFDDFSTSADTRHGQEAGKAIYLTPNPEDAGAYANGRLESIFEPNKAQNGANVRPVYARLKNPYTINVRSQSEDLAMTSDEIAGIRTAGHDGIIIRTVELDAQGRLVPGSEKPFEYVVFDPKNIRGKFAKFDPAESGSSKLLSAFPGSNAVVPAAAGAGGAAYGYANPVDANEDGVIDDQDRMITATTLGLGGLTLAGVARTKGRNPNRSQLNTFGGVNAKTADRVALGRAQNMEAAGADRNAIWDETGWFKGVDGKWRFEIDDSGSKLGDKATEEFWNNKGISARSAGVLHHKPLYDAYPEMRENTTALREQSPSSGSWDRREKIVYANASTPGEGRSVILHEGQHAVQDIEDFAGGGSPENAAFVREKPLLDAVRAEKKKALGGRDPYAIQNRIASGYKVSDADLAALSKWESLIQQEDEILAGTLSPYEAYKRLAGETEARNVQTRRDFSPAERRAKRPWETQDVPDDQQIVRFGGGKSESRPSQMGFGGGKGLLDPLVDAYGSAKQMMLPNDARNVNVLQEVLQGLPDKDKALIARNAAQDAPASAMAGGETPEALAQMLGRTIRSGDAGADASARSYQQQLADAILSPQRNQQAMDRAEKSVTTLDRKMAGDAWFPAREAERDAAMAQLMDEGQRDGGGIPVGQQQIDRLRSGITQGYNDGPLNLAPRDVDLIRKLIMDPENAQKVAAMIDAPVKPWVSNAERKAIELGAKGAVGGGALAAAIMGGPLQQQDTEADSLSDMIRIREANGTKPMGAPSLLGEARSSDLLPDGIMPTANPAQMPEWLNGGVRDTVERAQQRLVALGYASPKLPNGKPFVDGRAAGGTRQAVTAYQQDNGLPVTGDLDPYTLRHMLLGDTNYGPEPVAAPRGRPDARVPLR